MQGRASNFEEVLRRFDNDLKDSSYVAVDLELTGTSIEGEPDSYHDTAMQRLAKLCRIAERYVPIQMGFTIVTPTHDGFRCTSYNFYAFPSVQQTFSCQASALMFNRNNQIDFNSWIREGIPYMSREEEARLAANGQSQETGLLRLWKRLCEEAKRIPVVVHTPVDIFFLLSCFERRSLPYDRPKELAQMLRSCLVHVFDTAALHGVLGGFKSLQLQKFLSDAKVRHNREVQAGSSTFCRLDMEEVTAERYGNGAKAHEAGYDSLLTAQLFAYLIAIKPDLLNLGANRLFLYKSIEALDLKAAIETGEVGVRVFDAHQTLLVAQVTQDRVGDAQRQLLQAGSEYRRMDDDHILVVLRRGGVELEDLRQRVPSVQRWMLLETWRTQTRRSRRSQGELRGVPDIQVQDVPVAAPVAAAGAFSQVQQMPQYVAGVAEPFPEPIPKEPFLVSSASTAYPAVAAGSEPPAELQAMAEDMRNRRFRGSLKTFSAKMGFGFIACEDTYKLYKRDVFVHHSQLTNVPVGQEVSFFITLNQKGQPQAKDLEVVVGDAAESLATRTPSSARYSGSDVTSEDPQVMRAVAASSEGWPRVQRQSRQHGRVAQQRAASNPGQRAGGT